MAEGSWVGLDVHARSTVAILEGNSGELRVRRVPPQSGQTIEWLQGLPQPVRVAYEAGPTGYGLARACAEVGIACTVAAPSKIPRASGDQTVSWRTRASNVVSAAEHTIGLLSRSRATSHRHMRR